MIRGLLILIAFISVIFFPWPFAAALTFVSSFYIPLLPLAVGLFADTLYYTPNGALPLFTIYGALITGIALFVRSRLKASIITR
ncbi:MAG: hypothetical protein Q8O94_00160 [bacterium]|nr:hypothetical protein [bacterium]